ncbi:hypothetical protein TNCV_807441 [Trichonephila clavipes]|nr:hypothetical protein TNCV_807441 [Trichonephila clavipes]
MLKHLRFDMFELQETKLPVRLNNTEKKRRLVHKARGQVATPMRVKGDIEDVYSGTSAEEGERILEKAWLVTPR